MSSFLDQLPGSERESIRKRMRSPEAYERLREKVKGPEDLEREMEKSERMAELHFALESDPVLKERLQSRLEHDLHEHGAETVLERGDASSEIMHAIGEGKFTVAVAQHPEAHDDVLVVIPEGTVQEKIPVRRLFSERYARQLVGKK